MCTEMTDISNIRGWVLYDADCRICRRLAHRARRPLERRHFSLEPLQTQWVRERLQMSERQLLDEMRLLTPDGRCFGGADAVLQIAECFWWTWPIRRLARLKVINRGLHAAYRWFARNRGCASGQCNIATQKPSAKLRARDFSPLVLLMLASLPLLRLLPPWQFMWAMAMAQYAGFKWISFRMGCPATRAAPSRWRMLGYLLAWPGMNAAAFMDKRGIAARPDRREWTWAFAKIVAGAMLLWGVVRIAVKGDPLLAGWIAMIAMVLMLHFGLFELLSLAWRRYGVRADPIMLKPLAAASLAEFWSRRWNRAFSDLANQLAFRPLQRRTSIIIALLMTFCLSGLVHEFVITLPAGGGYGLPTSYFLLQALGIILQRSRAGRSLQLGSGIRGRVFVFILTGGPLPLLFPPVFIRQVILPMLSCMHVI